MPALLPIIAIIAVFVFISAHAATTATPYYRNKDYRSSKSRGGYSDRDYRDSRHSGGDRKDSRYERDRGGRSSKSRRDR